MNSCTVVATGFVVVSCSSVVVAVEYVVVDTGCEVVVPSEEQSRIGGSAGPLIVEHLKEEESKNWQLLSSSTSWINRWAPKVCPISDSKAWQSVELTTFSEENMTLPS